MGQEALGRMAWWDKEVVNVFAHRPDSRKLLITEWDGKSYWHTAVSGYQRLLTTSNAKDVAFVS